MKKNILVIAGCTIVLFISTVAYSAEDPYVSLNLGLAVANNSDAKFDSGDTVEFEFEKGIALSGAIGGIINDRFRAEVEIAYQENDLDKAGMAGVGSIDVNGDASSLSLLANGYYDFINAGPFTPFLSAGIGIAEVEVSKITIPGSSYYLTGDDDIVFAYQLGAGIGFAVNKQVTLDFKYRYFATSDPEFEIASTEFSTHNFYAGIRVSL